MLKFTTLLSLLLLISPFSAHAGLDDLINKFKQETQAVEQADDKPVLSEETVVRALKEALNQGIRDSVTRLSKPNGFFYDRTVKINMPKTLNTHQTPDEILKLWKKHIWQMYIFAMPAVGKTLTFVFHVSSSRYSSQ